jgi:hypothetical protein
MIECDNNIFSVNLYIMLRCFKNFIIDYCVGHNIFFTVRNSCTRSLRIAMDILNVHNVHNGHNGHNDNNGHNDHNDNNGHIDVLSLRNLNEFIKENTHYMINI